MITRMKLAEMLIDFIDFREGNLHRAVEMEMTFARCIVKGLNGANSFGSDYCEQRRDHYKLIRTTS